MQHIDLRGEYFHGKCFVRKYWERVGGMVKGWCELVMLGGWGGDNEFGVSLIELVSLLSLEEVIFLISKELVFLGEKVF